MKISRGIYLSTFILVFATGILLFVGEVLAQSATSTYENRQFHFAITPPQGWSKQVSPPSNTEVVVKFVDTSGTLTVAARPAQDLHKAIIDLISTYDLSEEQLSELAQDIYGKTPGVIEPKLVLTYLSSQRALGSVYAYEHRSVDTVVYMVLFKAETIRGNVFYKVEMAGPAAKTLEEASELFTESSELLLDHMGTFTFLPGKP